MNNNNKRIMTRLWRKMILGVGRTRSWRCLELIIIINNKVVVGLGSIVRLTIGRSSRSIGAIWISR